MFVRGEHHSQARKLQKISQNKKFKPYLHLQPKLN